MARNFLQKNGGLLLMIGLALAVAYFFSPKYDGFQTDGSGNTTGTASMTTSKPIDIPTWGWVLITIVILAIIGLSIWEMVLKTKGFHAAASGLGSGLANAGKGVRNWGASKLK